MGMTKLFCGIAAVSLIAGVAMAEPQKSNAPGKSSVVQLSDKQMDKVNAGFLFRELDVANTSVTAVFIGQPPSAVAGLITTGTAGTACSACYLSLISPNLSIFSAMGPTGQ